MNRSNRVFVDSNVLIAALRSEDTLHQQAIKTIVALEQQAEAMVISNLIFLEVVTILSQRVSRSVAVKAGNDLLLHPLVEMIHVTETLQTDTWQIFTAAKNKNISFVDCSIMAVMKAEGVKDLLTFDQTEFRSLRKDHRFRFWYSMID